MSHNTDLVLYIVFTSPGQQAMLDEIVRRSELTTDQARSAVQGLIDTGYMNKSVSSFNEVVYSTVGVEQDVPMRVFPEQTVRTRTAIDSVLRGRR